MWRTLLLLTLLVLSGPCESGCPEEDSPGSCSVDCAGTPLGRLPSPPSLPTEQLQQITRITIINCHVTAFNWTQESLSHLQALDLSYNSIADIDQNLLKSLSSLTNLTLHGNVISSLNDRCLESAKELTTLDLSSNNITTLHGSPFEASHLIRLNVSYNRISTLTESSLRGLDKLQLIDLSSNLISVLDNSLFRTFSALQWLNLSGNHLEILSEGYFVGLTSLRRLDVSVNCISRVSGSGAVEALSGLTEVMVAGNPLGPRYKELMVLVGTGRRLQIVDASGCNLTEVPGALTWSIRLLKLAHNQLTSIRRGDLDSYPLLHELDLSNNLISEVEEDALGRLESLSLLVLIGNRLTIIPNSLPAGLRVLHLDHNNIQYLNVGDLIGLPHLRELTMSHTCMMAIQDGALDCVPELQVLDLSDNPLERLVGSVLAGPQTLTILRLSHLSQVASDAARDLSFPLSSPERLQVLELEGSPVVTRQLLSDPAALAAFRDLHTLDLGHNQLTRLRSDLFHFLPRLEELRLGGNPWACDDMLWLAKWMQQQLVGGEYDEVRCETPPRFKTRRIRELKEEDFFTPTAKSLPPLLSTQEPSRMDHTNINDSLKGKTDSKEETFENQFSNKSRESDSKLKFPSIQAAPGINSFVETTNVDSSFDNKTHHGFLSTISVDDQKRLKNAHHTSEVINDRPLFKSSSNSTVNSGYKTTDKTSGKTVNNTTTQLYNSTVRDSESLADNRKVHGFNNRTKADNKDLYNTTALPRAIFSEIAGTSAPLNETSNNVVSNNKASFLSPKRTWPALRNANRKGSRNSLKNTTTINEMLPINKTRGEKVFDKMMRDLFTNNPLRTNENFSRLKSSSYGFRGEGVLGSSPARHATDNTKDPVTTANSSQLPSARSITESQTYPLSTPAPAPTPLTLATPDAHHSSHFPVQRTHGVDQVVGNSAEDYTNTSVVWGTIKSFSNIDSSLPSRHYLNSTELLIGIVHKTMDSKPRVPKINTSHLFRASDAYSSHQPVEKVFKRSHPGMYVLLGLAVGVIVVLIVAVTHFIQKRRRAVEYSRQQDIEVRSMSTVGEIW